MRGEGKRDQETDRESGHASDCNCGCRPQTYSNKQAENLEDMASDTEVRRTYSSCDLTRRLSTAICERVIREPSLDSLQTAHGHRSCADPLRAVLQAVPRSSWLAGRRCGETRLHLQPDSWQSTRDRPLAVARIPIPADEQTLQRYEACTTRRELEKRVSPTNCEGDEGARIRLHASQIGGRTRA